MIRKIGQACGLGDLASPHYLPPRMKKWLIIWAVFLALASGVHFMLTGLYSFQALRVPIPVRTVANTYAAPLFHQNWKMFAPDIPEYDHQLEYRFSRKDSLQPWSEWHDVSSFNHFGSRSRIEYMEQSLTGGLSWQIANNFYQKNSVPQFDRVLTSFDYQRALFFTASLHERIQGHPIEDSLQLRIRYRFTPTPGQASTSQLSYFDFPPYGLPHAAH